MKKSNFALTLLITLLTIGAITFFIVPKFKSDNTPVDFPNTTQVIEEKTDITKDPFYNLTIPYLRNRTYKSSLKDINVLSNTGSYTSYLTSYDSDGLKINGLLTVPNEKEPAGGFPAIVFVHGYIPPSTYQTTQNYTSYVDFLASNGFIVFKIDLRGHGESEGDPGGAYYSSDYIIDTLNAVSALGSSDFVNVGKVGLWGHSMGGNVVFRSLVSSLDISAAVIWAGAVYTYEDFEEYRISDNSYRPPSDMSQRRRDRERLADVHGSFDSNDNFWKMVVPTNYLDGVSAALQLNHAVDDAVVNIGYSRNLVNILNNTSITYEFNEYPSGGHNISGSSFNQAMQNTVSFFKKYLSN